MKYLSLLLFIAFYFSMESYAQETRKTDDALLLDYYQGGRYAEALTYLKTVYAEPVSDAKELTRLAYTASMANKLPEAEAYYQQIYNRDTTNKTSLYNMATINQRRGNNFKAESYLKKYIKLDTTTFAVYKQLANFAATKADFTAQLAYLQRANKLDSIEFDVAADLSDLYVKLKFNQQAEKVLSVAIAADPENIVLLQSLLKLASAQKKWQLAVKTGEQLLQAGDGSAFTATKLGVAYYQMKSYRCGIETLAALPDIFQTEVTAYFTGACYKQLKDPKNAVYYFDKAIKLSISPSTNTYYSEMGDTYEGMKLLSKAQSSYQKALLYDEKPLTLYFLANLFDRQLKDPSSALKYFKKYLASKPDANEEKDYIAYSKSRVEQLTAAKK
ncbi:tetratricopeptide repeat protein [Mucilaginibacter auburnensis]|uniref:Tetratricopeptide repeat protein n=1 Tax=Mucilaginibacter auburnensis TaxID=1457233 RepID=A0A2H9VUZ2_9SPHI|nr:tetratricopeptide repeat protein [Mucilaginibacter auburnensis]PJJ84612.1 tetratricopeptide repeat protein [Mucilaginibacter auburnensis]